MLAHIKWSARMFRTLEAQVGHLIWINKGPKHIQWEPKEGFDFPEITMHTRF